MCGICGVVQIGGAPRAVVAPDVLDWMTDSMTHRGPDDRGTYMAGGVALGARRLSIVDVAGGHQPVSNEHGDIWAIQNGELYNHLDIRAALANDGHAFASRCDTEILPHLYERDGVAYADRLRGKFATAVWDGSQRRAVLARDRLGVKPLYWAQAGDLVVFGSELKAVLASGLVSTELDYEAIDAFLTLGFVPGSRTPLAAVSKLLPGCRLIVDAAGVRTERYWEYPKPQPDSPALSEEEYADLLIGELERSVRLRLMSDVPLGAMLSGGLDSSLIVALMARNMSEPVKTFAVGFGEASDGNELADARAVSAALGTDHHELELSFADANVDLQTLAWYLDEPLADLSALGFLALSELAASHVTVALSGQGADELLGGYRKHRAAALTGYCRRFPGASSTARAIVRAGRPKRAMRAARTIAAADPALRLLAMSGNLEPGERNGIFRGPLAVLDGRAAERAVRERLDGLPDEPLPAALYLDAQLGLVDDMLHYFDRASMAHSLEVRVPFLDHHLVELCARIPSNLKVHRLNTKYILKRAARGMIPEWVIDKPKIGFFNSAVDSWYRAQAQTAIPEYLFDPGARYAEFLDRRAVEQLVASHTGGAQPKRSYLLFAILMLEVWLSTYLPRAVSAPSGSVAAQ